MDRRRLALLSILALALLTGCDSSDPIGSNTPASEVAGTYHIEFYSFQPDASVLPAYNLMDTLDTEDTELILADSREFVLQYRFKGGRTRFISGEFTLTPSEVVLRTGSDQSEKFRELLLSNNLVLKRDVADTRLLSVNYKETIDIGQYSSKYAGLGPVTGKLIMRLRQ